MAGSVLVPVVATWSIIPTEPDGSRVEDPLSRWTRLELVERTNIPDTWVVQGPADVLASFQPGGGCILTRDDAQVTSGVVSSIRRSRRVEEVNGSAALVERAEVGFTSHLLHLGGRIVYPTPTQALSTTPSTFPDAYDTQTGAIEDLILHYVSLAMGTPALATRELARLRLPTSLGRGGTTTVTGRVDNVGTLVQSLAEAGGLRVTVQHVEDATGAWLDLGIAPVADVSSDVRFGDQDSTALGLVTTYDYELSRPTTTKAIVGGSGDLADRVFTEHVDADAEALWNMSAETLVNQTQTAEAAEMERAALEALASGAQPAKVAFTVALGAALVPRVDFQVGDIVGYDLPGLGPDSDVVREMRTVVSAQSDQPTETVELVVGTPDAPKSRSQKLTAQALRRVEIMERS